MISDADPRQRLLIESLVMLAADAADQRAWVEKHRVLTDEFALDYEHAFGMVTLLVEEGRLDPDVLPDLQAIDALFSEMSGGHNADRWSIDALAGDPGWAVVRETARRVLDFLGGGWRCPLPDVGVWR